MLLEGKNAVIYGGGGAIGGAVARAFAHEGGRVYLAGRTAAPLDEVAGQIRAAGGRAGTAIVDALDEPAVDAHADAVAAEAGRIDISFNLISHAVVQGTPMVDMSVDDYTQPVLIGVRTTMRRQFASELGRDGIRVVTLRTGGIPESIPAGFPGVEQITREIDEASMLGRAATFEDVGNVAAFVASDRARSMTAATANISAGTLIDD